MRIEHKKKILAIVAAWFLFPDRLPLGTQVLIAALFALSLGLALVLIVLFLHEGVVGSAVALRERWARRRGGPPRA